MNPPSPDSFDPLAVALPVAAVLLVISLALVLWRLWRGPTTANRILALDLFGGCSLAVMVWVTISSKQLLYLDAVLALAIVGFVSTAMLSRCLAKGDDK
ncbi:MAG: monovalent cation/H+ antiporter complex subunit F [Opitutaceae bacterium]|nr:monovalent cation/H+ antiporter complex subunit F [Opitutaceae bacterium]